MGRPRRCKGPNCKLVEKYEETPENKVFKGCCCYECAIDLIRDKQHKAKERAAAKKRSDQRKAKAKSGADLREFNRKKRNWQHKKTKPVFNRMRRLQEFIWFRDNGIEPYCISCQKEKMDWACGHCIPAGSNSRLMYDTQNTFLQCNMYCNKSLSGNREGNRNTIGYNKGLIHRFGPERGLAIIKYCTTQNSPKKWEWQEIEDLRFGFLDKTKQLEKELGL